MIRTSAPASNKHMADMASSRIPLFAASPMRGSSDSVDFGFLGFPGLLADIADQRKLQFVIGLSQSRHFQSFHNRITIFDTVADAANRRIHNQLAIRNTQITHQDIQLLGQIDIDRAGSNHGMMVTNGGSARSSYSLFLQPVPGLSCGSGRLQPPRAILRYLFPYWPCPRQSEAHPPHQRLFWPLRPLLPHRDSRHWDRY